MSTNQTKPQGRMTVGEVAKKMGVTVRALQYYDREGLLSPSAVSEGGRRLYGDKDIVRLHEILSLKSLGFTLNEIKTHLTAAETPEEVAAVLTRQSRALRARIDALSQSLRAIEALKSEVLQIRSVDFKKYADIIVNLQMKNEAYRLIKYFDDGTLEYLHRRFDRESGPAFLNAFHRLREKGLRCARQGVDPAGERGQEFAAEFWDMITEFTGGDTGMLPELMKIGEAATENDEVPNGQNELNAFLLPALGVYFDRLGIDPFEEKS